MNHNERGDSKKDPSCPICYPRPMGLSPEGWIALQAAHDAGHATAPQEKGKTIIHINCDGTDDCPYPLAHGPSKAVSEGEKKYIVGTEEFKSEFNKNFINAVDEVFKPDGVKGEKWTTTPCSNPEHRLLGCKTLYYKGSLFDCYETLRGKVGSEGEKPPTSKEWDTRYDTGGGERNFLEVKTTEYKPRGELDWHADDVLARFDAEFPYALYTDTEVERKNTHVKNFISNEIDRAREQEREAVDIRSGYTAGRVAEQSRILQIVEGMKNEIEEEIAKLMPTLNWSLQGSRSALSDLAAAIKNDNKNV